jgi:hypothetical protein
MCRIYGKSFMYNGHIFTELKFKRKNNPNEIKRRSTKQLRPYHHRWQVYLPANSDASGLNTPTGGLHDAALAAYKTCVFAWLDPTLGLTTTAWRHLIASAWEKELIGRSVFHGSNATAARWPCGVHGVRCHGAAVQSQARQLGLQSLQAQWSTGPAICEAYRWGPHTMRIYLGHCSSVVD